MLADKTIIEFVHDKLKEKLFDDSAFRKAIEGGRFYTWGEGDVNDLPKFEGQPPQGLEVWDVQCPSISLAMATGLVIEEKTNYTADCNMNFPLLIFCDKDIRQAWRLWAVAWEALKEEIPTGAGFPARVQNITFQNPNLRTGEVNKGLVWILESAVVVNVTINWKQKRTFFYSPSGVS